MIRVLRLACAVALMVLASVAGASPVIRVLDFDQLDGWDSGNQAVALSVFRASCQKIDNPYFADACAAARAPPQADARAFFEDHFRPVLIGDPHKALFTGYYEPELTASAKRTPRFAYPIYRRPPELHPGTVWYTRARIERGNVLAGRGLEIAWLDDPVEAFFLQVQGSGRLQMTDGRVLRVGFAARNGHPYRSVGLEMARRGILPRHSVSASRISAWVRAHPDRGRALLQHNPSYIFFRVLHLAADKGPIGAMNVPVTAGRTIAVDPRYVPMGAPVWVEKAGRNPLRRLMVAQDAGSAIRGPQRADIFYGSGTVARRIARHVRDSGRMVVLLPIARAMVLAGDENARQ